MVLPQNTSQVITLGLDAILIADSGEDSLSDINHLRLSLNGKTAFIQVIADYLKNEGQVVPSIKGAGALYTPMLRHLQKWQNRQWT